MLVILTGYCFIKEVQSCDNYVFNPCLTAEKKKNQSNVLCALTNAVEATMLKVKMNGPLM